MSLFKDQDYLGVVQRIKVMPNWMVFNFLRAFSLKTKKPKYRNVSSYLIAYNYTITAQYWVTDSRGEIWEWVIWAILSAVMGETNELLDYGDKFNMKKHKANDCFIASTFCVFGWNWYFELYKWISVKCVETCGDL